MSDGNDFILGSWRGDRIDAGDGNDIVLGGGGRDVLDGGAGNDIVAGGRGNDVLVYRAAENRGDYDLYLGGRGCDTLVLVLSAAMAADSAVQAEIAAFEAYPAWAPFHFETLNLTVHSVERLHVRTLAPETEAPVLTDDALTVSENGAARTIDLLANDSDPDGTELRITSIDATGLVGELTDNGDGTVTFAPGDAFDTLAEGETAEQTITYTVTDGNGETSTATLTITVEGTNDAPVVGSVDLGETAEDTSVSFTAGDLLANATDVDGELSADSVTSVSVNGVALEAVDGVFTFVPPADFNGEVAVDFAVSDGVETVASTASITVTAANDAPVIGSVDLGEIDEDASVSFTADDLLANASDVDDTLTADSVISVSVDGVALEAVDGVFTFAPPADFNGAVTVDFTVSDGDATVASTASLSVTAVNDAPEAEDASAGVDEDATVSGRLTATDVDSDDLLFTLDAPVTGLTLAADGSYTFDASGAEFQDLAAGEEREVTASFTVSDGEATDTGELSVTVTGTNDAPEAEDASTTVDEGVVLFSQLGATDVDSADRTFTLDAPVNGLTLEANGSYRFNANDAEFQDLAAGEEREVTASFTVSDGEASDTGELSITVTGTNDDPTASAIDAGTASEDDAPVTIDLLATANDVDSAVLSATGISVTDETGASVAFTDRGDGIVAIDPDHFGQALGAGDTRNLTVSYDVSDGTASVANTASLVIEGRNEAPDAQDDTITTVRSATPVPRGEAFAVAGTQDEEDEPAVAVLADGGFVVAYEREEFEPADPSDPDSFSDFGSSEVFAQRYAADGTTLGEAFQVNTITEGSQDEIDVVGLADGGFMVTWEGRDTDEEARLAVRAQRYDADGAPLGGELRINEGVTGDQPQVVQLTNGNLAFVWEDNDSGGSFGRVVAADGTAVTSDFRLNAPDDVSRATDPKVAALADGGFVTVWPDDGPTNFARDANGDVIPDQPERNGPYGQLYDAAGNPIGSNFVVSQPPGVEARDVEVAGLTDGGFAVVWDIRVRLTEESEFSNVVVARVFDAAAQPTGDNIVITTEGREAVVAARPDGGFAVVWDSTETEDGFGLIQAFDAQGNPASDRVEIADDVDEQDVALLANGDLVVTWDTVRDVPRDADGEPIDPDFEFDEDVFGRVFTFDVPIGEDGPNFIAAEQLLANDSDFDGDDFRVTAVQATEDTQGNVVLSPDGSTIAYFAGPDFPELGAGETATDTFSYTITDENGLTDTATVTVEVQGMDDFMG